MAFEEPISNTATLSSVIKKGVRNALKEVHTCMPGIIVSFDPEDQTAKVQPAIKRVFKTVEEERTFLVPEEISALINVPVFFPRGGGYSFTYPINEGDECLLIFSERAIDNWFEQGGCQEPKYNRMHALSDAVAFVGLSSKPNVDTDFDNANMVLKSDNGESSITITDGGVVTLKTSTRVILDTPESETTGNLTVQGNLTVDQNTTLGNVVTSGGKDISLTHSHDGSPTAPNGPVSPTGQVI